MEYCAYTPGSALGKRSSCEENEYNTSQNMDNCTRGRLKGRRVQACNSDSEVLAIYNFNGPPAHASQCSPMDIPGQKRVLALTWEQFQVLDKRLCSGMCVRIVAP